MQEQRPPTPTVSRLEPDGSIIELIYDPLGKTTSLAEALPDGVIQIKPFVDLPTGERLVPYAPTNNLIAHGCVLLPSAVGEAGSKTEVLDAVRAFLHRYVDLSPLYEEIAAHYVLLSWVYDAFNELPYLRFRGEFGTGKTRALLTVGSVCYKPFFASGASTVSPLFHILDAFAGTLVLDEADFRISDQTADLTKILNNGNVRGLPVLRTMTNRNRELNPQAFQVFGPKLLAMRGSFNDQALESRFLTEETGRRQLRSDVPISLPTRLRDEAQELRNRLLAWRLHARFAVSADSSRLVAGISARANQIALPLLALVDDVGLRSRIGDELKETDARTREAKPIPLERLMLDAIAAAFDEASTPRVRVSEVAERVNTLMEERGGRAASVKWVGWFLRERLRLQTMKAHGVYVIPQSEAPKIEALSARLSPRYPEAANTITAQPRTEAS